MVAGVATGAVADFPDPATRNVIQPGCTRCSALVESRECIAWGTGPRDAAAMVVGEAPGAGDPEAERWRGGNWTGMAYTTRHSGRRVRDLVADAGLAGDCYFTNAVKCFPAETTADGGGGDDAGGSGDTRADADHPDNRPPTEAELANCRGHLEAELATVEPALVLPTGRHATRTVLALGGADPDAVLADGFVETVLDSIDAPALDAAVVPLLHPSYADVWRSRLGYDRAEYVAALREVVAEVQ